MPEHSGVIGMHNLSGIAGTKKIFSILSALMLTIVSINSQAATSASTSLIVNVIYTPPSCNITMPSSYDLGTLLPGGEVEHPSFDLNLDCSATDYPLKTALTATIVKGNAVSDNKVRLVRSDGLETSAFLFLKESGGTSPIKLTGSGANMQGAFCSDATAVIGPRTCKLTPVTKVESGGVFGLASATLRFQVSYP